ncbi:MAG TPA: MMPL family transporter [Acidimicrobiales bacterium]|jgi:RND superfamily putative drug exporter|nr:MMPL family transporter [Acidimicrobiales bacterium]
MFTSLARLAVARTRLVLVLSLVVLALAAFAGIHAFGALKSAGFVSPNAPSQIAANKLNDDFSGPADLIFLVTAHSGTVDSPAVAAAGRGLTARLASTGVAGVTSYWSSGNRSLESRDRTQGLVLVSVRGHSQAVTDEVKHLAKEFDTTSGAVTVRAGGGVEVGNSIGTQITGDLAKAETVAIPLTLIFLIFAFGSLVSALLPVAVGTMSIFTTLAVLWLLSLVTNVSQYALNLTTSMSLGLAIDYSLLMVYRYREELAAGWSPDQAVTRAVHRAGRTILFSAATVAAALAALLLFPVYFLRSFAYAGISVVVLATLGAVVVLPAMLAALGTRVNAWRIPVGRGRQANPSSDSPFWRRVAQVVMARPIVTALPILAALIVLAIPFAHVEFGTPDDRVLAPHLAARAVGDALRTDFASNASTTTEVVTGAPLTTTQAGQYEGEISRLAGVTSVQGPAGAWSDGVAVPLAPAENQQLRRYSSPEGTWISAVTPDPLSARAQNLVKEIRALPVPGGSHSYVGGQAASLVDQKSALAGRLPLAMLLIALTTFVLLWLFTGSVILPLKALVLNALTLLAVLGAMVWIFQYGHLSGFFDFTATPTSTTIPLLLFCIAFGLSMDYEVFLLSRIKEAHDHGADNNQSVVDGLARVGRLVSMAAGLMAITFFSFAISKVSFIQMFALGTGAAVIIDATLVRGVLVPSFMRLAGEWNWWSPASLRRLHQRIGVSEMPEEISVPATRVPVDQGTTSTS